MSVDEDKCDQQHLIIHLSTDPMKSYLTLDNKIYEPYIKSAGLEDAIKETEKILNKMLKIAKDVRFYLKYVIIVEIRYYC